MDDLNDQIDKKEFSLICGGTIFKCYCGCEVFVKSGATSCKCTFCGAGYDVSDVD